MNCSSCRQEAWSADERGRRTSNGLEPRATEPPPGSLKPTPGVLKNPPGFLKTPRRFEGAAAPNPKGDRGFGRAGFSGKALGKPMGAPDTGVLLKDPGVFQKDPGLR